MKVFTRIGPLQAFLNEQKTNGKSVGLVPTMGALHPGHASLVEASRTKGDFTVCSLFVNPAQFNDPGDLAKYPRDLPADERLLTSAGCQALFAPDSQEMYKGPNKVHFDLGQLDKVLEGKFRPGHFSGVALVVSKLFNIFRPHRAYFGQKDYQQFKVIALINEELNFDVELHCMPTVREQDGLAMSSRNLRLKPDERREAASLFRTLTQSREALLKGHPWPAVRAKAEENLRSSNLIRLEYFELTDKDNLQAGAGENLDNAILLIAAFVGAVRLIDNLPVK
jgi:pantoate--beta-alanine ligase